jgi:triosephosphate isomerase
MRRLLVAANWKMYKTPQQALSFVESFLPMLGPAVKESAATPQIVLFPPAIDLPAVVEAVNGTAIGVGAQNMHFAEEGAYTGDISASMVTALGAGYILIGHSERRQYGFETDEMVNKKLLTALKHKLLPIVCVGEHLEQRNSDQTEAVLHQQTYAALKDITPEQAKPIVIAYEPIWAIGTGKTATPEMAADAHRFIRNEVSELLGPSIAESMRILYGGSVKPENAQELMQQEEIDGALVGGASLDPASFYKIVQCAS